MRPAGPLAALWAMACAAGANQDTTATRGGGQTVQGGTHRSTPPLPSEQDLGRRAWAHVKHIVELGPRVPGSKAREKAADYICARLSALDLQPIRESWLDPDEKIRFENVRVRLPGRSEKTLLIGTHYDTKMELEEARPAGAPPFAGANDGGSGSGILLALIEDLVTWRMRGPTLEFVWFDGEESITPSWNMDRALFGSKEFVRRHLKAGHSYGALVLLDMVGHSDLAIDREETSSKELFGPFERAARALGYAKYFFQHGTAVDDDHVPFLNAGLPSIDLIQFEHNPEWHTHRDTMAIVSPKSLGIVGRVVLQALPNLELQFLGD